jgi:hypothetical protein
MSALISGEKLMSIAEWRESRFTTPPDKRTVRGWCESGYVPAKKIGRNWFVIINKEIEQTGDAKVDSLINSVLRN